MSLHVLVVDPGLASGFAFWDATTQRPTTGTAEFGTIGELAVNWHTRHAMHERVVVCESFIIGPHTAKHTQAPWSLEVIGVMRWFTHRYGAKFVLQKPVDAKGFVPDARLKKVEWFTPGRDHENDALRHLYLYLTRAGVITPHVI